MQFGTVLGQPEKARCSISLNGFWLCFGVFCFQKPEFAVATSCFFKPFDRLCSDKLDGKFLE